MNIYRNPFILALWAPLYQLVTTVAVLNDFLMAAMFILFTLGLLGAYVSDFPLLPTLYMNEVARSEEHTSELQSRTNLVCRLLLEKKKKKKNKK